MAWTYSQKTGALTDPSGKVIAHGYSGKGQAKNDPTQEHVKGEGPIPRGLWKITELRLGTLNHGPFVLVLTPAKGTRTHGRSGFLMHGDSRVAPGTASLGCIVASRPARETVWNSGDRDLKVVE